MLIWFKWEYIISKEGAAKNHQVLIKALGHIGAIRQQFPVANRDGQSAFFINGVLVSTLKTFVLPVLDRRNAGLDAGAPRFPTLFHLYPQYKRNTGSIFASS